MMLILEGIEFLGEGFDLHALDGVVEEHVLLSNEITYDLMPIAVLS